MAKVSEGIPTNNFYEGVSEVNINEANNLNFCQVEEKEGTSVRLPYSLVKIRHPFRFFSQSGAKVVMGRKTSEQFPL